jgi:hypothetical protein
MERSEKKTQLPQPEKVISSLYHVIFRVLFAYAQESDFAADSKIRAKST